LDIFKAADKNNSGTLTVEEFEEVMDDIILRYPQVEYYLQKNHILDLRVLWNDPEGNERKEIDIEGFKRALSFADSQVKTLPATAQVCIISPATDCFLLMQITISVQKYYVE
jgi:NADH:ubiquinone reductase (non-electrogenic)